MRLLFAALLDDRDIQSIQAQNRALHHYDGQRRQYSSQDLERLEKNCCEGLDDCRMAISVQSYLKIDRIDQAEKQLKVIHNPDLYFLASLPDS